MHSPVCDHYLTCRACAQGCTCSGVGRSCNGAATSANRCTAYNAAAGRGVFAQVRHSCTTFRTRHPSVCAVWYPSAPASTPQSVRSCVRARVWHCLACHRAGAMPNGSCRRRQQLRCATQRKTAQRRSLAACPLNHSAHSEHCGQRDSLSERDGALSVCLAQY